MMQLTSRFFRTHVDFENCSEDIAEYKILWVCFYIRIFLHYIIHKDKDYSNDIIFKDL